MMLKCVSFSPLVPGKVSSAIHKSSYSCSLRKGAQHPPFYLLAAKSCGPSSLLHHGEKILAAFKLPKQFGATPLTCSNVNHVNGYARKSLQAVWPRSAEASQFNSAAVKAIHGKPNVSAARLQEGQCWSASSSSGRAPRKRQASGDGHGPWLLFGLCCICASAAAAATGSFAPRVLIGSPPAAAEALARRSTLPAASSSESEASHGKKVYFDYHATGVPGDGRCLFRAVAHGACLRSGRPAPDESTQRQMADDLRNKALDELVRRRESSEWFIEGDFDAYVRRMRLPHTWGGEPELLMLSNVLRMPITVYMKDKGGVISIAEYSQEYGTDKPIRVLYHGFGHYEALHLPEDTPVNSRLSYCSASSSKTYPTRRKR